MMNEKCCVCELSNECVDGNPSDCLSQKMMPRALIYEKMIELEKIRKWLHVFDISEEKYNQTMSVYREALELRIAFEKEPEKFQYTEEEVREKFLNACYNIMDFWRRESHKSYDEKMEGLVHSILALIDGENVNLPEFLLIPNADENHQKALIDNCEKYYPAISDEIKDIVKRCNISGSLHTHWWKVVNDRNEKNGGN